MVGAGSAATTRVALVKAELILAASLAVAVAAGIVWKLTHPHLPLFDSMGVAAGLNFPANLPCLHLPWPYRQGDVNLSSAWACSPNDV